MEFKLNEDQQMIQDLAYEFCTKVMPEYEERALKEGKANPEGYKTLCESFMGIPFPEKYGGANLGWLPFVLATEQFARHGVSMSNAMGPNAMFICAVLFHGSQELKDKYIPAAIAGEGCGSFAFTEPDTGSDPKQLRTKYTYKDGVYKLNGVKRFITNAGYEGPIILFAKNAETDELSAFIGEKFAEGYSLSSPWELIGNDTAPIYDVFLDDYCIPESNMLGKEGDGFKILKSVVALSKITVAAGAIGTMGKAYDIAVKYAKEKMHRDKPISKFPTIQAKVADIAAMHQSAQLLVYRLADHADDPSTNPFALVAEAGMVKGYVADLCVKCVSLAQTVLSAYGYTKEYGMDEVIRTAYVYPIVEGAGDLQRIMCGSYILRS